MVLVDDAARLAIGIQYREEGLARIAAKELEDRVDAVVLVDCRQHFNLFADKDFIERLRVVLALAEILQMRKRGHELRGMPGVGRAMNQPSTEIDAIFAASQEFRLRFRCLPRSPGCPSTWAMLTIFFKQVALARLAVDVGDEVAVDLEVIDGIVAKKASTSP